MKHTGIVSVGLVSILLVVWGGAAFSAEDKYTLRVPGGLSMSEFRGYETWEVVSASHTGQVIDVIVANPEMIEAYKAGAPDNGKSFPDGSKMAKIHWTLKKSAEAPAPTFVPDALQDIDFMVRDSKRFGNSGSWGYAQFNYDTASAQFVPQGTGAECGTACHSLVKTKDYVFTAFPKR